MPLVYLSASTLAWLRQWNSPPHSPELFHSAAVAKGHANFHIHIRSVGCYNASRRLCDGGHSPTHYMLQDHQHTRSPRRSV
ncbi:hypothetical protein BD779DRAFT_281958 [Infundibulicybe gibba]|nr:hypothetical protein BD779DRAFT_281958 [Infundibulicybe gibba]